MVTLTAPEDLLDSNSTEEVNHDFATNASSPLFAPKEAIQGFKQLFSPALWTFIMTGNELKVLASPQVLTFGTSKISAAYIQ